MGLLRAFIAVLLHFTLAGTALATPLPQMRITTSAGVLYDLDPLTGAAHSPRSTGLGHVVGIDTDATGRLFALTSFVGVAPNSFYAVEEATGHSNLVGSTGLSAIYEGDLAFNPQDGLFYGVQDAPQGLRRFFRINPATGSAVHLASLGGVGDFSGLTYGRDNRLYCIDVARDLLLELNPFTGAILTVIPLSQPLDGDVCGMDYDPAGQELYVAGRVGETNALFTLNPATGELVQVGLTGVPNLSGLTIIPEPATSVCLWMVGFWMAGRSRGRM